MITTDHGMIVSVYDVEARVRTIDEAYANGDNYRAESLRTDLYEQVLKAIARGQGRHVAMARAALSHWRR